MPQRPAGFGGNSGLIPDVPGGGSKARPGVAEATH